MSNDACFDSACDGFFHLGIWPDIDRIRKWSLYCCELPILFDFDFIGGQSFGVIDGLVKTLFFLYDMGSGLHEVMNHNPFSITWWADAIKRGYNEGNYTKAFEDKFGETKEYWKGIKNTISTIFKNLSWDSIKTMVIKGIKDFLDLLNPLDGGLKSTGYAVGIIAFEVILTYLTGGGAQLKKLTQIPKVVWDKLRQLSSPSEFRTMVGQGLKYSTDKVGKLTCRILNLGCFVKNTKILVSSKQFRNIPAAYALAAVPLVAPIQNIQPDDIVIADKHESNYYATVSNDDDLYIPGWQDYDYLDITPETWQIGKFIITEEDGGLVEIEANRPKEWFEENQLSKFGDRIFLYMPEMGVAGNAKLLSIRPTNVDTRKLPLNKLGQIERPVITTFKRFASEVLDYYFSDGGKIGCTSNHPFFSVDRQAYIPIGELTFGETVQTSSEREVKFIGGISRDRGEPVYNIEVWREHNYYVGFEGSEEFVLVHNTCWKWGKKYNYSYGDDLPEKHIFDRHAHNSTYNSRKPPSQWKSEFAQEWSSNIDDLKAFIDLSLEDGIATLSNLVQQGPNKWAATIDLTDVLDAGEFVGRKRVNGSWVNTKVIRVVYDEKYQSFVTAFPD